MAEDFLKNAESYFSKFTPRHTLKTEIWETLRFIMIALVIVLPIRFFVAQPFIVKGTSMVPTLDSGEYLIIDEISYRFETPSRGDVVVFKYPRNPKQYFVKRVIGLPGETVVVNEQGQTIIKDTTGKEVLTLNEPYVKFTKSDSIETTLGADEYFMMGDNRAGSYDSRMWGPVNRDHIVGRAFVRLFPFTEVDIFPGEFNQ